MKSQALFGACCILALGAGIGIGVLRPVTGSGQTVGPGPGSTPRCTANSVFLSIPSLNALSSNNTALQVRDFSFGVQNPVAISSTSSGAGAGKAVPSEATIGRPVDGHSLAIFHDLVRGTDLGPVTVELRGVDSSGHTVLCQSFGLSGQVVVTSQQHASDTNTPNESVSILYSRLSISAGGLAFEWNFALNATAARISAFTARDAANRTRFYWRLANKSGVAGFNLYAGKQRLNAHLIPVHHSPVYRYSVATQARDAVLHVVLTSGMEMLVPAA